MYLRLIWVKTVLQKNKKSHTCEAGGHTSENFFLAFIDELWKTWKIRLEKMKKIAGDIISHVYQKPWSYEVQFLRYRVRQKILWFWAIFALLTPSHLTTQKIKFWKNEKSIWRCHHFKLVQQKTQSYDVCLLRYGVQQT